MCEVLHSYTSSIQLKFNRGKLKIYIITSKFSSVQSLSHIRRFVTPWTAARQASLPITNSRSLLKLMSIESVMPYSHLTLSHPFSSCLQSFPASQSFQMSQFFASGGQSIGASPSVFPMNIQGWFPLGWTGWISLLFNGLSRVFSKTTKKVITKIRKQSYKLII